MDWFINAMANGNAGTPFKTLKSLAITIDLPEEVIKALDARARRKASSRAMEARKMIVHGLKAKGDLDKKKLYL